MSAPSPVPAEALRVIDAFAAAFNQRDPAAIDATLHFPHYFPGPRPLVWEKPDSLDPGFFQQLIATGWDHSVFTEHDIVLSSADKIHLRLTYTRNRADGSVIETYNALWILARIDGRWGIQARSAQ